jgi:cytochrome P450
MASAPTDARCPVHAGRDDRKSAAIAARECKIVEGSEHVGGFNQLREILRSPAVKQGINGDGQFSDGSTDQIPVIFLDGETHKRRRAAIARYFTPKAIETRYRITMEKTADALIGKVRKQGRGRLDDISFDMAVSVAAEIVGLSDTVDKGLSHRIAACLSNIETPHLTGLKRFAHSLKVRFYFMRFFLKDVKPAIKARRAQPREDVLTHLIEEGYSDQAILIECVTYGTAGMITTREFIAMVAWHMFDNPELKDRYLAASEADQIGILEEILRLEPVAAYIYRRAIQDAPSETMAPLKDGALYALDIRAANTDEAVAGECPLALDPERGKRMRMTGSWMSFGDGGHRCPGAQVALAETRIFIDRLMRVPGIRLAQVPEMNWNANIMSYELRNAIVTCDPA